MSTNYPNANKYLIPEGLHCITTLPEEWTSIVLYYPDGTSHAEFTNRQVIGLTYAYAWSPVPTPVPVRWKAQGDQKYFYVEYNGEIKSTRHVDHEDDELWELGNYYKTRAQAEDARSRVLSAYKG